MLTRKSSGSCLWLLASIAMFSISAPRSFADPVHIFLDSRPTTLDPQDVHQELILREIPRQALLIALEENLDSPCVVRDATIEPAAQPSPTDIVIGVERKLTAIAPTWTLKLKLLDGQNRVLDETDLPVAWDGAGNVDYEPLVGQVSQLVRNKWLNLVAKQASATTQPSMPLGPADVPEHVDDWLKTIDFHHSFLAARLLHSYITQYGPSPTRLAALARAYANLGESTRHLWDGQSSAFFARAMLYSERLTHAQPKSSLSWWTDAYVEALLGAPISARTALAKAQKVNRKKIAAPEWVDLTRSLADYNTQALSNKADPKGSGLASYFAFLTVEHAMLPSLPIKYARAAIQENPNAQRLETVIVEKSGVSADHPITDELPTSLNMMTALLGQDADDSAVRDSAEAAQKQGFSSQAIIQLRDTLQSRPAEDGQPLPWSTYAAFLSESEFLNAMDRVYYAAYMLALDPKDEIRDCWPLISDHRYAPLIGAICQVNRLPDPGLWKKAAAISFKDDVAHCHAVPDLFSKLGLTASQDQEKALNGRENYQADGTVWDRSRYMCEYSDTYMDQGSGDFLRGELKCLAGIAPDAPLVTAYDALLNWETFAPKADATQKSLGNNPIIAFAIGVGYGQHGHAEKAIPILQSVTKLAPDTVSYAALAGVYLVNNDEENWLKTWAEYLDETENFGTRHTDYAAMVAVRLDQEHRFQDALPYAKIAADSGFPYGLRVYATALADLHRYDEAADAHRKSFGRNGNPTQAYRFFVASGRGDRAATAKAYPQWYEGSTRKGDPDFKLDYAIYFLLEGQPDQADAILRESFKSTPTRMTALLLACRALEQNKQGDVAAIFAQAQATPPMNRADEPLDLAIAEFQRCLADPAVVPARDGALVVSFADPYGGPQSVSSAYALGRLCELRQKLDDARWWYRQSFIPVEWDYSFRPLAAVALRRLGEDPYK